MPLPAKTRQKAKKRGKLPPEFADAAKQAPSIDGTQTSRLDGFANAVSHAHSKNGAKASQRIGERILGKSFNCQFVAHFGVDANEVSHAHSKNGKKVPPDFAGDGLGGNQTAPNCAGKFVPLKWD